MRVFVLYDHTGEVTGTIAVRSNSARITAPEGINVHAFESDDVGDEERRKLLADLFYNHHIVVGKQGPALTHRAGHTKR